jgi:hypothetical protein
MLSSTQFRIAVLLIATVLLGNGQVFGQGSELIFSAMGDVPYSSSEEVVLQNQIEDHNLYSPSIFMVHVGDIKPGGGGCPESVYSEVAGYLLELEVPTFIIPGDNEWSGCSNPDQAWSFWTQHFMNFEQNFCGGPVVERQSVRPENFAWVKNGVLLIGINMVGGVKKNPSQWDARLQDNVNWVIQQFQQKGSQVRAAVIFAHALKKTQDALFYDQFLPAASSFGKPILWINGNDHSYKLDNPFSGHDITRVTVDNGGSALPIQVTVKTSGSSLFVINRTPWNNNSQPINGPPCGQDGPAIAVNPTSHDYGQIAVGGAGSKTFVVSNNGNQNLNVTGTSLVGTNAGEFSIDSGGGSFTLTPSATRNVAVSFNPTSQGNKNATLRFANNDPDNNPLNISISGSGIVPQPDIAVNPSSHNFGQVTIGDSDAKLFVVSNSGSLDLNVTATSLVGSDAGEFNIDSGGGAFSLSPGANRNILISFSPNSQGSKSATLRLNSNDPDEEPFNVSLSGSGSEPGSGPFAFNPSDDAYVNSSNATSNFGTSSTLRVRNSSTVLISYLKFVVSGISGSAQSATLRLFVTQSNEGGSAYLVSNNLNGTSNPWTEGDINWNNAPAIGGSALSTLGNVTEGQWAEFDVTSAITGNGTFSFAIRNTSSSAVFYSSKEGSNAAELVVNGGGSPPAAPTISSFTPTSGLAGTQVTIFGSDFGGASQVTFNNVAASSFSVQSSSEVRATVPAAATTGKIRVTTSGGTAVSSGDFTVTPPPAPAITSFTPTNGPAGTTVTINGSNFSGTTNVSFNGESASFTVASSSQVRATVPAAATDGPISVTTPGGSDTSSDNFDVTSPPPTNAFNPTDDAYVRLSSPTSNAGNSSSLRVRKTGSETIVSYLKFDVSSLGGPAQNVTLRLFVTDASPDGGEVFLVSNNYEGTGTPWVQSGLNWNNAPAISGGALAVIGAASINTWIELDVSVAVSGNGVYSFAVRNNSSDVVYYGSREGTNQPELVIETASGSAFAAQKAGDVKEAAEEITFDSLPETVQLSAAYPNPFNLETTFEYSLPEAAEVSMIVFNIKGQKIQSLASGWQSPGVKTARWNGRDESGREVGSGSYLVRLIAGNHVIVQKITLQK